MRLHHTADLTRRPGRTAPFFRAGVGVAFGALWISGCSVLYDLSTDQCSTNQDCVDLGGVFTEFECRDHLCQEPLGCKSHAECIEAAGDTTPVACVNRECIPMLTNECPTILPAGTDGVQWKRNLKAVDPKKPLILAGTGLVGGTKTMDFRVANYDLALTELSDTTDGLKGGLRPVVMLACNADPTPEELETEMAHLARLKVPGMVSAFYADVLQSAFNLNNATDVETKMFFVSPLESDPTLAGTFDGGRIWHMGPSPDVIARAYAPLVTRILDKLGLTSGIRVATVVASGERFLNTMNQTISNTPDKFGIVFNGVSIDDNIAAGNYKQVNVTLNEDTSTEAISQLLEFKPHVILSAAGIEFVTNVIPGVEAGWPLPSQPGGDQPKPFYILSPFNAASNFISSLLDERPSSRSRIVGINGASAADPTLYRDYFRRFSLGGYDEFAQAGTENFYDAAYFLVYSAAAYANSSELTQGDDFRRGMLRLLSGMQFNVGPTDMINAFGFLHLADIQLN